MRYMIDTYGNVDLGTLNWQISGRNFYTDELSNKIKKPKDNNTIANIYCNLYRAVPLNASFVEGDMAVGESGALYLRDTRYTTTAEFKEAMRGQILRYELETPANGGYLPMYKERYKVSDVCQLLDKSKYPATQTINGVTFTNNGDGSITVNHTATTALAAQLELLRFNPIVNHIYLCIGCPSGGGYPRYRLEAAVYDNSNNWKTEFSDTGNGEISSKLEEDRYIAIRVQIYDGYTPNNLVFKPQLFDLTEMYGAGNEPTTVEEFRQKFPDNLYPYSTYCWAKIKQMRYMIDTYGNVDLGTLNWHISGSNFYTDELSNKIKKPKDDNTIANIYCNLYRAVPLNASFVEGDMGLSTTGYLYIRDTRYTTTAEFKEAMRGQILRYELETPANGGYLPLK